ncbi:conserved hypothetical protein [Pseudoalteromonas sp. 3J6]|jgi:hypothetical protein|nr:hypothetical protein PUND_a1896 [Pseudoalteromonas undina]GAA62740.1 hypothetical protein P20311_0513 [Pseudoalteromonas sp. BSi20311]GAA72943.1 hypothetical protein P20439_3056 [Pseudoalteromonas sp. BSi20439]CAD2224907.1 conserved hypothetical protein [Pseudoalteromonas sp. 3J6]|tara:strand:- start:700 stop:843 length:144 start_codon:yes stop_codon:yes gene_type:complete
MINITKQVIITLSGRKLRVCDNYKVSGEGSDKNVRLMKNNSLKIKPD